MLALRPSAPQPILSEILRIFSFFAATMRVELKLQLEVFFERLVFAALGGGRKDSPLVPLVLDTLTDLSYDSSFLVDLYVNYDCDPQRSDLMETLYKLVGLRGCCEVALGAGVGRRGGVDAGRAGAAHHVQRHQVHRQPHRREAGGAAARHRRGARRGGGAGRGARGVSLPHLPADALGGEAEEAHASEGRVSLQPVGQGGHQVPAGGAADSGPRGACGHCALSAVHAGTQQGADRRVPGEERGGEQADAVRVRAHVRLPEHLAADGAAHVPGHVPPPRRGAADRPHHGDLRAVGV